MDKEEIISSIKSCMAMQNSFNAIVNDEWKKAHYSWRRAMWVECAELMDHVKWKWWKDVDAVMDQKQTLLEVVDIFHFLLSDRIEDGRSAVDLYNSHMWATKHTYARTKEHKLQQIEEFVLLCLDKQNIEASFFQMMYALDINIEDLLKYYVGKNVLNKFRQDNGYKRGSYIKEWTLNGITKEDNKVLEEIIEGATHLYNFDELYNELETIYDIVKKGTNHETE